MNNKVKQMQIVEKIVEDAGIDGIRTEQVKIQAMYKGVSCADRYLRWLREKGVILCEKKLSDRTKTWYSSKFLPFGIGENNERTRTDIARTSC